MPKVRDSSRLQSALEYLTTYGWAILIIGIVAAVFIELGLFTPQQASECILQVYFSCEQYSISTTGTLSLNLLQTTPDPINVIAVGCNSNVTFAGQQSVSPPVYILPDSNAIFSLPCYSGTAVANGKISKYFTGSLTVNYIDTYTNANGIIFGKISVPFSH